MTQSRREEIVEPPVQAPYLNQEKYFEGPILVPTETEIKVDEIDIE